MITVKFGKNGERRKELFLFLLSFFQEYQTCDDGLKLLNDSIRSSNSFVTGDFFDELFEADDDLLNNIFIDEIEETFE